jgi:hypothetical protein
MLGSTAMVWRQTDFVSHVQYWRMTRVRRALFVKPITRVQCFSQPLENLHFY